MENLHWCRCKNHCVILHTLVECKCCREYENLLSSKLQNIDCISQHEEFKTLCLNNTVLQTAFVRCTIYDEEIEFLKNLIKCKKIKLFILIYVVYYNFSLRHVVFFTGYSKKHRPPSHGPPTNRPKKYFADQISLISKNWTSVVRMQDGSLPVKIYFSKKYFKNDHAQWWRHSWFTENELLQCTCS